MSRPWYRSPVLWFGLPGLIFLVFAWVDSMSYSSSLDVTAFGRTADLGSSGAHVGANWRSGPGTGSATTTWALEKPRRDPWPFTEWFPLPAYFSQNLIGTNKLYHILTIPYWFLILLYLGLWQLPWLFRYHRRRKIERNLASTSPAAAD